MKSIYNYISCILFLIIISINAEEKTKDNIFDPDSLAVIAIIWDGVAITAITNYLNSATKKRRFFCGRCAYCNGQSIGWYKK